MCESERANLDEVFTGSVAASPAASHTEYTVYGSVQSGRHSEIGMKCHYEVLEIARDADDDQIKKAYRKLALKWHPDKNPDNIEECTQYFALLQQANEVLSDPHERAFYDKHRESILKGGFDGDYKDDAIDVFRFFSSSCYRGFEGDKGFYSVYRNLFDTIANEDYDFVDYPSVRYPSFGEANSDYNTVVGPFYGFWSSFCTARSFAWLDKYDVRDGETRFQVRAIEAENKKFRDAGRTERNDQIRELVAFVRKRDPRIKAYRDELELKQIEAKRKQEENRKRQIQRNMELTAANENDEEVQAARRAHLQDVLAEHEGVSGEEFQDEDEEGGERMPYCIVCDKSFKSQNALVNHENSKQHRKQLAELRKHMKEEDSLLFDEVAENETDSPAMPEKKGKKAKRRAKKKKAWDDDSGEDEPSADVKDGEKEVSELADELQSTQIGEETKDAETNAENNLFLVAAAVPLPAETKKKRRADKSKKAKDDAIEPSESIENHDVLDTAPKTASCQKCGEFFESRSRLFDHLKQTGHATLLKNGNPPPVKNKKGKRK